MWRDTGRSCDVTPPPVASWKALRRFGHGARAPSRISLLPSRVCCRGAGGRGWPTGSGSDRAALGEHFPGGSGSPVYLLVEETDVDVVVDTVLEASGTSSLAVTSADSPSGTATVTDEGIQPAGPAGTPAPEPTVASGQVLAATFAALGRQDQPDTETVGATGR